MLRTAAELVRQAVGLVYPNSCLVCDHAGGAGASFRHGLCSDCRDAVAADPFPACPWCAQTVGPHSDISQGCGECRGAGFAFEQAIRLGPYAGKLRDAVLRTKLLAGEGLADQLGRILVEERRGALAGVGADTVVPVPLHWWRKWRRGYNQAEALAREVALALGLPFEPRVLRRVRLSTQHVQPTRAARFANAEGIFGIRRGARLAGKAVLLVDDVMTTGSTMNAAARALRGAGVRRVVLAVVARR